VTAVVAGGKRASVDHLVPEEMAMVTVMAEVMAHPHPVMTTRRTLLLADAPDVNDGVVRRGILVQVQNQASSGVADKFQLLLRSTLMRSSL